jgi:hypothetical protein
VALRALEEREAMARRVAEEASRTGRTWSRQHFADQAQRAARHAEVLRHVLIEDQGTPEEAPSEIPTDTAIRVSAQGAGTVDTLVADGTVA